MNVGLGRRYGRKKMKSRESEFHPGGGADGQMQRRILLNVRDHGTSIRRGV
jgi:hypothetical protein